MSITKHHTEWLSLLEISGPFLSLPVLNRTFPQGLETVPAALRQDLRAAYEEWRDNQGGVRADDALHRAWIEWVLTDLLEMDDEVLFRNRVFGKNPVSPSPYTLPIPEHGVTLTPDFVIVTPSPVPGAGKGEGTAPSPEAGEGWGGGQGGRLLVLVVPPDQDLEKPLKGQRWAASPATRMMMLLHGLGVRLGLVTNGERWMIVDAPKGATTGYISWYAGLWFEEPLTLQAFVTLFNAGRFFGVDQSETIEALLAASAADQQTVTDQLGYQVRHAVELLVQALDLADRDSQGALLAGVTPGELYEAAVVVMMRLVFLLTAEERKLLLLGDALYDEHYALSTLQAQLRALADQQGEEILAFRYDGWQRLLALFRGVHGGIHHDRLPLPAYGGDLFDPARYPFLEGHRRQTPSPNLGEGWGGGGVSLKISNRTVLHLLEALQFLQVKIGNERQARRLSFRALDVEQIGMVYEGLLDHTARRATAPVLGLSGTRDKEPELPLAELERSRPRVDLLAFLAEATGRSTAALSKGLDAPPPDLYTAERLRVACDNDETLYARVRPWHGLIRDDDYGRPVVIPAGRLYVTSGTARRASGAHYTPSSLGEPLVQHTLEPLVYIGPAEGRPRDQWQLRTAEEILRLKICDMAMGSGALLVQVCRYLADRLLEAWALDDDGQPTTDDRNPPAASAMAIATKDHAATTHLFTAPTTFGRPSSVVGRPSDPAERLTLARRLIAQRCLYGVDKNPLAVEMAKLSLWLVTMDRGKPFTFLDHALRCGDSLIGVDLEQVKCWSLERSGKRAFGTINLELDIQQMIDLRREIEAMPADDVQDQAIKRYKLTQAQAIANDLISAADDLVASYYNTLSKSEQATLRAALLTTRQSAASLEEKWRALANLDGLKPFHWQLEFPEVFLSERRSGFDGFVGNPPFIGGLRIRSSLGERYLTYLKTRWPHSPGVGDYCAYFFLRAFEYLQSNSCLGLIATNTIAQGDTRELGLDYISQQQGQIYRAINNHPWPGQAAVVVNVVHIHKGHYSGEYILDNVRVTRISQMLDDMPLLGPPKSLKANSSKSFIGSYVLGAGFTMTPEEAQKLIKGNQKNKAILFPYLNGQDLNSNPDQSPTRWVINFFGWPLERTAPGSWVIADEKQQKQWLQTGKVPIDYPLTVASDYPECLAIVREKVYPQRMEQTREIRKRYWWRYGEVAPTLYETISSLRRVLVVAQTSRTLAFSFVPNGWIYSLMTVIFAYEEDEAFAILQSAFHESWARKYASTMKQDLRYTPSDIFENYPFPADVKMLNTIGATYHEYRRQLMLARQEGLTATYNRFHDPSESAADIARLRTLHIEMDHAVAAAYGWTDLDLGHGFHATAQGLRYTISEAARREVLTRLLALNHERHAEEVAAGLHGKKAGATKPKAAKGKGDTAAEDEGTGQLELFG